MLQNTKTGQFDDQTLKVLLLILILVLGNPLFAQIMPVEVIKQSKDPSQATNLVFLGDGYTASLQSKFVDDARLAAEALLAQEPFVRYKDAINIYAVKVISNQSGASLDPANLIDNYFGSSFWSYGIERLLVAWHYDRIHGVLMDNVPFYDIAVIIVNDDKYGGSGGSVAVFSTNTSSAEVFIHELGHSFSYLADEYWAGPQYAMEKPNMTRDHNPTTNKWRSFIGKNGVGIYPYEEDVNWHRPHQSCKMRQLGSPFCDVCGHELESKLLFLSQVPEPDIPIALFGANKTDVPMNTEVQFKDMSSYLPTSWYWVFEGGEPTTSTDRNPKVKFSSAGSYAIQLTVKNSLGENTITRHGYINVVEPNKPVAIVKNTTIYLDDHGIALLKPEDIDNGSSATLGIAKMELSKKEFSCGDIGTNKIVFSVTDNAGNIDAADAIVTVIDSIRPIAKTKNIRVEVGTKSEIVLTAEDVDDGSYDNCKIARMQLSKTVFTKADFGKNIIDFFISDLSSNTATVKVEVIVDVVLSTGDRKAKHHFSVFPNPSSGYLIIVAGLHDINTLVSVEVIDLSGRILKKYEHLDREASEIHINLTDLAEGPYLLKLKTRKDTDLIKFVLTK